jgi:hypothetical protein
VVRFNQERIIMDDPLVVEESFRASIISAAGSLVIADDFDPGASRKWRGIGDIEPTVNISGYI